MIDIKLIRENVEEIITKLATRQKDFSYLREVKAKDEEKRELLIKVENLKKERNEKSKLVGQLKREKKDATEVLASVAHIGEEIAALDEMVNRLEKEINYSLLITPNILHESVPIGKDETENVEIRRYLTPTKFDFTPKAHYELGEKLDILDFERATKITGSRFVVYKGLGARLERSLIAFMMDLHSNKHGYTEIIPPYIVNRESMIATGQLPKFEEDAFKLSNGNGDWFLNPTAEVPTINMYRNEIISFEKLPIYHCSYTMAFRSEAGSAGRDTRGLIRTHQFNKVELIKLTTAESSYQELEKMLLDSEEVLKQLKLPYHVVSLCSGDMGFGMAKTYDIEVWLPSQNAYREIGSISNAEDYQARRGNIKTKRDKDAKLEYVHTLNGSGLAVGRTLVAIMENYQQADGSIKVPEVLIPYMGVDIIR
ncbi:MAG TPA: serine--tRNA ligase [Bacilli bacterium]|jgi:seryl-tRNA synthetase|nr:serine--tRNA ligase [Acholeplasmataceae bacterium]HNZ77977.1 serine--tRNA ligase [Bacilli bacterium]HOD61044.1 serine--tRNA ligase [Bacilli bacterium]HOH60901.1 serine--tRNA ligase [Bacilli bacterium]HPB48761.1 serine--tRNA ligase [Bacilli bacterium]